MRDVIKYNTDKYKIINIDNINNIDLDKVKDIQFKTFSNIGNIQRNIYTDYDNYCVLYNYNTIFINEERYKEDKYTINNLLNYIVSKTYEKKISIYNKDLINDELINTICNNINIDRVIIYDSYILTKKHFEMFEKACIEVDSEKVSDELQDVFHPLILHNWNKKLIGKETYPRLLHGVFITINNDITDYELENFKYISEYCELVISNNNINDYKKILNRVNELNLNIPICFNINSENKEELYNFISNNNIIDDNLYVYVDIDEKVKISEFLKYEKILYEMVVYAKDLSPFERYIYAYNITKQFKKYKESENSLLDSRLLYRLINNDYIVCVGFSKLFGDLLNKLGIKSRELSTGVDNSYVGVKNDAVDIIDNEVVEFDLHSRRYVHLIDEKYNIDGFFISDPTWDNDLEKDYYNHMIMTNSEVTNAKNYIELRKDDIFNVESLEEYILKMKRIIKKGYDDDFQDQISYILETIKILDKDYYQMLYYKYYYVKDLTDSFYIPDNVTNLVYDLGVYIVSKVNKVVSGETIFKGVKEVYKHSYGYKEEELNDILDKVRVDNKIEQNRFFPIRYKVDIDGNKEIIMNENNKFDFNLDCIKKM